MQTDVALTVCSRRMEVFYEVMDKWGSIVWIGYMDYIAYFLKIWDKKLIAYKKKEEILHDLFSLTFLFFLRLICAINFQLILLLADFSRRTQYLNRY